MARPAVLARNATSRVFTMLAAVVRLVAAVIGGLILLHAVFVLFEANPGNPLVSFTAGVRDTFSWFTQNLFSTSNPKFGQAINDAIGGLIYVVVGNFASKLITRFAPAPRK